MHEYGTTSEQMAMVAEKNWSHASLNPKAQRHGAVSVTEVLNSPMVCDPFHVLDCCPQSDGAAAVIVCAADRAHEFTDTPIYVAGFGLATDPLYMHEKRLFTGWECTRLAARRAYTMAGIEADQLDLAEVHDCFTGVELLNYEDLGLCAEGMAGKAVEVGDTRIGGRIPVNPSGGLIAKGHPIGATGVAQLVELYEQLREEAGARQVNLQHGYGLQHNVGGYSVGISVVTILGRAYG